MMPSSQSQHARSRLDEASTMESAPGAPPRHIPARVAYCHVKLHVQGTETLCQHSLALQSSLCHGSNISSDIEWLRDLPINLADCVQSYLSRYLTVQRTFAYSLPLTGTSHSNLARPSAHCSCPAMLPESLHSSYEQYKADTDIVASWLAITARQYGYTAVRAEVAVASKGPKLRGRE